MADSKLRRVGEDNPNCCQAGNCFYEAVEGAQFCHLHGGSATGKATERQALRNYILQNEFGKRAGDLRGQGCLKDVSDEIVIMRVTLESIINSAENANMLMLYSDKIEKLCGRIQSLVESLQKVQERNKELMDRETVTKMIDDILGVIVQHVTDPDALSNIAEACNGIFKD